MSSDKNPGNVVGGHKANIANPNTSKESKEHSQNVIQDVESGKADLSSGGSDHATEESGKETNRVIGGLTATIHNPNTGEKAKQQAKAKLEERGVHVE